MQLTGDLSDFALTDILQILSLSRKTGVVSLAGSEWEAKIVVESGRITHASSRPGETLADSLAIAGVLDPEPLRALAGIGKDSQLEKLLLESGILTPSRMALAARLHTQRVIGRLVALEKGRFSIALGEAALTGPEGGLRLAEGLDVGEALLSAAHERDESYRSGFSHLPAPGDDPGWLTLSGGRETGPLRGGGATQDLPDAKRPSPANPLNGGNQERSDLLCSLLAEMRQNSFEAEVSLLIMRYASAFAARGILFAVRDSKLCGLGQFGLGHKNGRTADDQVRDLCFPLDTDGLFGRVVRTSEPYVGPTPDNYWVSELLSRFGGAGHKLTLFVLPLTCNESPSFIIYGDNYPGNFELKGVTELVALASQASLALERIALQKRVMQLESGS